MNVNKAKSIATIFIAMVMSVFVAAEDCKLLPAQQAGPEHFFQMADGQVLHIPTGLVWTTCPVGMTWQDDQCSGSAQHLGWQQALEAAEYSTYADHTDWRLPNVPELHSIIEYRCSPVLDNEVFPGFVAKSLWTSTSNVEGKAYRFELKDGELFRTDWVGPIQSGIRDTVVTAIFVRDYQHNR